jgi:hypothetical protein
MAVGHQVGWRIRNPMINNETCALTAKATDLCHTTGQAAGCAAALDWRTGLQIINWGWRRAILITARQQQAH